MTTLRAAGTLQGSILVAQAVLPTMGAVLLVPVLPLLFREYGAMRHAEYWIPALLTVPGLCIALLSPLFGVLTDRVGRRPVLITALLFYGLAGIAPLILVSFTAVFASRILLVVSATMIGDYYEGAARSRWLAMISTVASLSAAIFLGVAGILGDAFGWRGAIVVYAASLLFVPAMLFFTWEPRADARSVEEAPVARSLRAHLWLTGACTFFGAMLFYTLVLQQGLGLAALGTLDPRRIGLLTAIASLGNPVGTLVFRRLATLPITLLLSLAFLSIGSGLVAIGWVRTDGGFAAAAFVGLLGAGLLMPTLLTWTMKALPFATRGRGTAVFQSMFSLGQFGSSLSLPFLTAHFTGSILGSFVTLGIFALIGFLVTGGVGIAAINKIHPNEKPI